MKNLHVVRDNKGAVIATYELANGNDDGIPVETNLESGQTVELLERVPSNYLQDLPEFFKKCRK